MCKLFFLYFLVERVYQIKYSLEPKPFSVLIISYKFCYNFVTEIDKKTERMICNFLSTVLWSTIKIFIHIYEIFFPIIKFRNTRRYHTRNFIINRTHLFCQFFNWQTRSIKKNFIIYLNL